MEILLIDIGALAMFFACMAIAYWHGVSHGTQPMGRRVADVPRAAAIPGSSDLPSLPIDRATPVSEAARGSAAPRVHQQSRA